LAESLDHGRLENALLGVNEILRARGAAEISIPSRTEPEVALRRAVMEQAAKRRLVRPLDKRGAWIVLDEEIVTNASGTPDVRHTRVAEVRWLNGQVKFHQREASEAVYLDTVRAIDGAYARQKDALDAADVSAWLIKIAYQLGATSLRDTGGVYFVPRQSIEAWRLVVGALSLASDRRHNVFQIPAMKNDEAIEAILDAITVEASAEAQAMEDEIVAVAAAYESGATEGTIGKRALAGRANRCASVLSKVASYESLLGVKMDTLRQRLEALQAHVAAVALMADAADNAN
jgi:hypothetical protein